MDRVGGQLVRSPESSRPHWERDGDAVTGWLFPRPTPLKIALLSRRPYVSCSYWDPAQKVADAEFADDEPTREKMWDLFSAAEEPLGYDPRVLGDADHTDPKITVLRMTPWRLST